MAIIISNFVGGGNGGIFSGEIYRTDDLLSSSSLRRLFPPPAVGTVDAIPSGDNYGNRQYLVGGHTTNILIDEDYRVLRQGMAAPNVLPSVTVGAGSVSQICYTRFYDEITGERSPLSDGLSVNGSVARTWSNLPTDVPSEQVVLEGTATFAAGVVTGTQTNFYVLRPGDRIAVSAALNRWATVISIATKDSMVVDDTGMVGVDVALSAKPWSRASHVELWVSVDGSFPRLVMRVRIGTATVSESTPTLSLGEAEIDSFEAMPFGTMNLFYNDRQLVAGVEGQRDHVFLSAIGFPERYEGLAFVTAYNEPIVGMFKYRDYVVLLCPDSSYRLQGHTEDDYARTVLDSQMGGMTHLGNRVTDVYAFVPGRKGIQIFNGAFHPGIPTRRSEWTADITRDNVSFERGFAVVNPNDETYQFYPDRAKSVDFVPLKASVYVGSYGSVGPQAGGSLSTPEWLSDQHWTEPVQAPEDSTTYTTFAAYLVPKGQKVGSFYRGDNEGRIWKEDELDEIPLHITSIVALRHDFMDEFGGGAGEGKELVRAWTYVKSEHSNWQFRVYPGDDHAYPPDKIIEFAASPQPNTFLPYHDDIAASRLEVLSVPPTSANWLYQAQSVHLHVVKKAARGFTAEFRFLLPLAVQFYGWGGVVGPGKAKRPLWSITPAVG